ncbi:MAG: hypothetical protein ABR576_11420 [Thermoanaerobaculia bacterium]
MKKTLMTCLVVVALFAVAGTASAITCTVDQRPAATLLVPYFEVAYNADGTLTTGAGARDTLLTIVNASAAPMIAHVNVFNERSVLVLDYNIALTGFDVQAMSIGQVLLGNLPRTGYIDGGGTLRDACQRNPSAPVYPAPNGFIRVRPAFPALPEDNTLATTLYPIPAYPPGSPFAFQVIDSLDSTSDQLECDPVDGVISGLIRGYITIDHVNYCNLSNPRDANYYLFDAIGNENNLWGEVIFLSGAGVGTFGGSTVNIEADASLDGAGQTESVPRRTFYRRYWSTATETACSNCGSGIATTDLLISSPWNTGIGDRREPLGLKYAARYFEGSGVSTAFRVWRGSSSPLEDLTGTPGGNCTDTLPTVALTFYDEDENTVTAGVCPSPCTQPSFNFPLETQRLGAAGFSRPAGAVAGWVNMSFFNSTGPRGGVLDQAWVEYEFQGPGAFLSMSAPGTQLDPTTCSPLGVPPGSIIVTPPAIPAIVGTGS